MPLWSTLPKGERTLLEGGVMAAEIYWTPDGGDDEDLIPCNVVKVTRSADEIIVFFGGRDSESGDEFEGILRLKRRLGEKTVKGKQACKPFGEDWENLPLSAAGSFENRRFDTFTGTWAERGRRFRFEIVGRSDRAETDPAPSRRTRLDAGTASLPRRKPKR